MTETWSELDVSATPGPSTRLAFVLSTDDLLARRPGVTLVLDRRPRPLKIGRAPDGAGLGFDGPSTLAVPDRFLSGHHASLVSRDGKDVLVDERSRNGTFVNGERIDQRALEDHDLVEVGHSLFVYRKVDLRLDAAGPTALGKIDTASPELRALLRDLARIAPSKEAVLVLGETGVGKEVVAGLVHAASGRSGPFGTIDAGAIPDSLFESTFFGHQKGAFTGAAEARIGEIARADGGTLFLDEIGNMSLAHQAKLLRVIETGRVTPIGAAEPVAVDVRWVAATNRDILHDPEGFRPDLLQRLSGYVARIPPLRRRREDLGALTAALLGELPAPPRAMTIAAARRLYASPLAGNVRELRQALRTAALLAGEGPIDLEHLPPTPAPPGGDPRQTTPPSPGRTAPPSAAELEAAVAACGGNVVHAARALGTSARQLYRWFERAGVDLERYRGA